MLYSKLEYGKSTGDEWKSGKAGIDKYNRVLLRGTGLKLCVCMLFGSAFVQ